MTTTPEPGFRTRTEDGQQIICCGRYTYRWAGQPPLAVGAGRRGGRRAGDRLSTMDEEKPQATYADLAAAFEGGTLEDLNYAYRTYQEMYDKSHKYAGAAEDRRRLQMGDE